MPPGSCPYCGARLAAKAVGPNRWLVCTWLKCDWEPELLPNRQEKTA